MKKKTTKNKEKDYYEIGLTVPKNEALNTAVDLARINEADQLVLKVFVRLDLKDLQEVVGEIIYDYDDSITPEAVHFKKYVVKKVYRNIFGILMVKYQEYTDFVFSEKPKTKKVPALEFCNECLYRLVTRNKMPTPSILRSMYYALHYQLPKEDRDSVDFLTNDD